MKKSVAIGIVVLIVVGVIFFVVSGRDASDSVNVTNPGQATVEEKAGASDFDRFATASLSDYNGNSISLEQFRGTPVVINSWAVWCPFCRAELSDFAELQKEFGDRVTVIAIDRQEPLEKAKGFTDELGITDDMMFLLDRSDSFYKSIGGFSMPETIFVNSSGEIVVHKRGPMDLSEMREHTNKIVNNN